MVHPLARGIQRATRVRGLGLLGRHTTSNIQTSKSSGWRCFHSSSRFLVVKPYLLADIGEGITECQIISWFVQPGDRVEQFDRICEVQSDKASVEITSRFDGTIKAIHYATDDMAIVGRPLLDIDIEGDVSEGDEAVIGEAFSDPSTRNRKCNQVEERPIDAKLQGISRPEFRDKELPKSERSPPLSAEQSGEQHALVIPGVRHMLKKLNIDINSIRGTGRDGLVTKEDVLRYEEASAALVASAPDKDLGPKPVAKDTVVSLTATEKQMFKVMTHSLTIPHFLYTNVVDLNSVNRLRRILSTNSTPAVGSPMKLSFLPFLMKALSQAFSQFPKLNAHLDVETNADKPQFMLKTSHNFGIAVDTPYGLLVPVIRNVQNHSVISLAAEILRLGDLAKEGRLSVEDFRGATFTLSNVGSIGGSAVGPVIVAPMVGILGIGRSRPVPVFEADEYGVDKIVKRQEIVLSWSADHRVLDGATVARCAEMVRTLVENVDILAAYLK